MFERLLGLETEYAVRFASGTSTSRPTDRDLFNSLVGWLSARLPAAKADEECCGKPGVFLANGSAVWFESRQPSSGIGLIEGSTAECRSPRDALAQQRALDQLLREATEATAPGRFFLYKNCRDSAGHSYGAQENYEARLASGWRLTVWRCGINSLMAMIALSLLLVLLPTFVLLWLLHVLVRAIILLLVRLTRRDLESRRRAERWWAQSSWLAARDSNPWLPVWIEVTLEFALRIQLIPVAALMSLLFTITEMASTQSKLLPFLLSRMVWAGAGWLDARGHYHVAEKATSRNRQFVLLLIEWDRPIYGLSQFIKLCFFGLLQPHLYRQLMADRQRMQIGIGDSNLCEEAEYLRIGATLLVIDAIEAGFLDDPPRPRSWKRALWSISRDTSLKTKIPCRGGRQLTAVQIQRSYLNACRRYVHSLETVPEEAWDILTRWSAVLDDLEDAPERLVGRVDWVTKKYLLDRAGADLPQAARKKIDLRYHELSPEGYFFRLAETGVMTRVLTPDDISRATRLPPSGTRASERGRIIREFSGSSRLVVSWGSVLVGEGETAQRIALAPEWRESPRPNRPEEETSEMDTVPDETESPDGSQPDRESPDTEWDEPGRPADP